jgi:carbonic anhydrase
MTRFQLACFCLMLPFTPLSGQDSCPGCSCGVTRGDPWTTLQDGFYRFVCKAPGKCAEHPHSDRCARCCGIEGQKPFAVVLCCSDSRVPPEILFDQGLGDLFVVRVAGNVASDEAIGSIEYAIAHLKTIKIIVVMGHQNCGAVTTAMDKDHPSHDMIPSILNRIYPAVAESGNIEDGIKDNVRYTVKLLRQYSPIIRDGVPSAKPPIPPPDIKGVYYPFKGTEIEVLRPLP